MLLALEGRKNSVGADWLGLQSQPCFSLKRFSKQRIDTDPFRPGFDLVIADFGQTHRTVIADKQDSIGRAPHFIGGHQAA